MYRPNLRPGEELVKISPGVNVKNVPFDAFLTSKRIIFVKKTDSIQERKELVFPLNLVKDYQPSSDESGTPAIKFSIEKPSGEVGDLILKFIQAGDYRYAERDDWVEDLKSMSRGMVPRNSAGGQNQFSGGMPPKTEPSAPPAHNRDADLFSMGSENPYAPPSPEFSQPPAEDSYYGQQDFRSQARQGIPPEERHQMQQGFSQPPASPQSSYRQGPSSGDEKPIFCRFCGAKVPSGSAFCPSCGGKVEQQAMHQQSFSGAPPQRQQADRQQFLPPPAPQQQNFGDRGFVSPPPPPTSGHSGYGQQPGYPPREGGISLADDRAYGYGQGGAMSPKGQKSMMKEQAKADKARMKEQARAEKERQKAMKRAQKGRGYNDPYGYMESRMPEPKIIIIAVAVIAVIAVACFAFSSGMFSGNGGSSGVSGGGNSQSSSSSGTSQLAGVSTGTTNTSETYGNWYFSVFYPGEWSGTYTVNGGTTTITDESGESVIYGTLPDKELGSFSGTVSISASILDSGAGGTLSIYLYNDKGVEVDSAQTSGSGTAVLTYP
ncbi:hypothetical protein [Methanolacinia petrolearia]|uniref:hypothetical protein n=1 Tax=Methanolacinia petrolearia TaxID=54120 RepID=UPI003BAAA190